MGLTVTLSLNKFVEKLQGKGINVIKDAEVRAYIYSLIDKDLNKKKVL
jgi:hypothetical protein